MSNDSFINDYKLFKDQPEKTGLKFAHETICDWLYDVILKSPRPFRLAITRNLGTGKSTILKTIQDRLKDKKQYEIAYVDVWKLDKESSRRSALIKIANDLNIERTELKELEESIYGSITELSEAKPHQTVIDKMPFWKWTLASLGVAVIIFFLLYFLPILPNITTKIGIAVLSWFVALSIKTIDKTFINIQRTFNRAPIVGAEEFENSLKAKSFVEIQTVYENESYVINALKSKSNTTPPISAPSIIVRNRYKIA